MLLSSGNAIMADGTMNDILCKASSFIASPSLTASLLYVYLAVAEMSHCKNIASYECLMRACIAMYG